MENDIVKKEIEIEFDLIQSDNLEKIKQGEAMVISTIARIISNNEGEDLITALEAVISDDPKENEKGKGLALVVIAKSLNTWIKRIERQEKYMMKIQNEVRKLKKETER